MINYNNMCVYISFYSRYALTDLIESERDYVKDLKFTMDNYHKAFDNSVPAELEGQKDYVFATFGDIRHFHEE